MFTVNQVHYYQDRIQAMQVIDKLMRNPSKTHSEFDSLAKQWHRLANELEDAGVYERASNMVTTRCQHLTQEYRTAMYPVIKQAFTEYMQQLA